MKRRGTRIFGLRQSALRLPIGIASICTLLLAWELYGRSGLIDPRFSSSPSRIFLALAELSGQARFWNNVRVTASAFAVGLIAACLVGIRAASPGLVPARSAAVRADGHGLLFRARHGRSFR